MQYDNITFRFTTNFYVIFIIFKYNICDRTKNKMGFVAALHVIN